MSLELVINFVGEDHSPVREWPITPGERWTNASVSPPRKATTMRILRVSAVGAVFVAGLLLTGCGASGTHTATSTPAAASCTGSAVISKDLACGGSSGWIGQKPSSGLIAPGTDLNGTGSTDDNAPATTGGGITIPGSGSGSIGNVEALVSPLLAGGGSGQVGNVDPAGPSKRPAAVAAAFPIITQGIRTPVADWQTSGLNNEILDSSQRAWLGDFYAPDAPKGWSYVADMSSTAAVTVTRLSSTADGTWSISVTASLPVVNNSTGEHGLLPVARTFWIYLTSTGTQIVDWRVMSETIDKIAPVAAKGQALPGTGPVLPA